MRDTDYPGLRRQTAERRAEPRLEVRADARLAHDDGTLLGALENLACHGANFATEDVSTLLEEGDRVVLLGTPGEGHAPVEIAWPGRVVRVDELFDGERDLVTYAIAFDEEIDADAFDITQ